MVETEANGDSWNTYEGVLPWLVCWAFLAGTRDFFPALAALFRPVQIYKYFSPSFVPIVQQNGQAVVRGCLFLNTFLWLSQQPS
jgi:hypothetical protein